MGEDEGLWDFVKTVRSVGCHGEITFFSKSGPGALLKHLLSNGYGDWWCAGKIPIPILGKLIDFARGNKYDWGVRSRFTGVQLHLRGYNRDSQPLNVHIDLHNPGDQPGRPPTGGIQELPQGIEHYIQDERHRNVTHTWPALVSGLRAQGVTVVGVE